MTIALAARRHRCVAVERHVDDPAIPGAHRVQRDDTSRLPNLVRKAARERGKVLLPALAIALHVDDHPAGTTILPRHDAVEDILEGIERLAAPPDQEAAAVATHREDERAGIVSPANIDRARKPHVRED